MKFKDQLKFMRKNMKKNRLRVFMTILATTMACAFLIVLASVGFGIQKTMTEEVKSQQVLTEVTVQGKETDEGSEQLTRENLKELAETDNVTAVVRRNYVDMPVEVTFEDRKADVHPTIITNMEEEFKANLALKKGEVPKKENEVIVGYHFAKTLLTEEENQKYQEAMETSDGGQIEEPTGYEGNLIGKEFTMNLTKDVDGEVETKSYTFKISGVAKEPTRDWMQDRGIYINDEFREEILTFINTEEEAIDDIPYTEVFVYASGIEQVEQVTNDIKDKGYMVYSITEELNSINLFFTIFKAGLIFVGTIAVLIASIGIFNTMTMAVTERTQEIGIMKALGAQPNVIRRLFLMESAYIGIVGSIIGVAISYAISFAVNMLLPLVIGSALGEEGQIEFTFSYIPVSLVLISAGISIGVAMISGFRPAVKATNINVLSALRREL